MANVPSRRYTQWITVFEQLVSEAQKQISALSKQERLYNVVREFLELQGYSNDIEITVKPTHIAIEVKALPTNTKADIEDFHNRLALLLYNNKLRMNKDAPTITWGGDWYHDASSYFSVNDGDLFTTWKIPFTGIADLEVEVIRAEVTRYHTTYALVPRKGMIDGTS